MIFHLCLTTLIEKLCKKVHIIKNEIIKETNDPEVTICIIPVLLDNYSYIIISGNSAIVIDPADGKKIEKVINERNLQIKAIIATHDHLDHTIGIPYLVKRYNVEVYATYAAFIPVKKKIAVSDKEILSIEDINIEILYSPGHKVGIDPKGTENNNIMLYLEKAKVLFTGDTLFSCGCGCFQLDQTTLMMESLKKIKNLPDDVQIYAGHEFSLKNTEFACSIEGDNLLLKDRLQKVKKEQKQKLPSLPTSIKMEKEMNPFLKYDDSNFKKKLNISEKKDFEALWYIRKKKNDFKK